MLWRRVIRGGLQSPRRNLNEWLVELRPVGRALGWWYLVDRDGFSLEHNYATDGATDGCQPCKEFA